ncbi:MAG: MATE family efflux transporter [Firmicutes bacterium]|nr:MATE family efflux transporter [Bacillota bacterium]
MDSSSVTPKISTKEIRRQVANIASPALVEMVLVSFVNVADMIMVGRLGASAIAAVGLANQPIFLATGLFQALNVGTTALVARFVGADMVKKANATAKQSLVVTAICGALVSIIGYLLTPWVMTLMGARPEVRPLGITYMKIVCLGLGFRTVSTVCSSALRGAGDTRTPMAVNLTANLVNVVGNYLLIYGHWGFPRWEIAGAAVATSFADATACGLFLTVLFSGRSLIKVSFRSKYRLDWNILSRVFTIGVPAAVEQLILRGGQVIYVRIVSSIGTTVLAAHQIGMNILSLSFMPGQAFSIAATTLVGQGLGAKDPDLAERSALETSRMGMTISTMIAGFMFFFGRSIAGLYTNDPQVVESTAMVLRIIGLVQPAQSTRFILSGGLRGAGDTRWPLYSTFVGIWGVRVALGYILAIGLGLGLFGAWLAMAVDQIARALIIHYRFRRGGWKKVAV